MSNIINQPVVRMNIANVLRGRLEALSDRDLIRVVETYNAWFGHAEGSTFYLTPFNPRDRVIADILSTKPFAMPGGLLDFAEKFI